MTNLHVYRDRPFPFGPGEVQATAFQLRGEPYFTHDPAAAAEAVAAEASRRARLDKLRAEPEVNPGRMVLEVCSDAGV